MNITAASIQSPTISPLARLMGGAGSAETSSASPDFPGMLSSLDFLMGGWGSFALPGFPPALALPNPAFGPFSDINVPQVGDSFLTSVFGGINSGQDFLSQIFGSGETKSDGKGEDKKGKGDSAKAAGADFPGFPPFLAMANPAFGPFADINVPSVGDDFLSSMFGKINSGKGFSMPKSTGSIFDFPSLNLDPFMSLDIGLPLGGMTPENAAKMGAKMDKEMKKKK